MSETVTAGELEADAVEVTLDEYSIILSLPHTAYSDEKIVELLAKQGYKTGEYQILHPLPDWKVYEQVFQIVVQNLRKKGALAVVINHDTGEVLSRIEDKPMHSFMRLVQLVPPDGPKKTLTSWEILVSEDD